MELSILCQGYPGESRAVWLLRSSASLIELPAVLNHFPTPQGIWNFSLGPAARVRNVPRGTNLVLK